MNSNGTTLVSGTLVGSFRHTSPHLLVHICWQTTQQTNTQVVSVMSANITTITTVVVFFPPQPNGHFLAKKKEEKFKRPNVAPKHSNVTPCFMDQTWNDSNYTKIGLPSESMEACSVVPMQKILNINFLTSNRDCFALEIKFCNQTILFYNNHCGLPFELLNWIILTWFNWGHTLCWNLLWLGWATRRCGDAIRMKWWGGWVGWLSEGTMKPLLLWQQHGQCDIDTGWC